MTARLLQFEGEAYLFSATRDITEQLRIEAALQRQATTDELTGLPNRRDFFRIAAAETETVTSNQGESAVALIDIDNFMKIIDTLGHAAGDDAVRLSTQFLSDRVSDQAMLARLGGDEFGLLLPGFAVGDAQQLLDHIRRELRKTKLQLSQTSWEITFSAGLVTLSTSVDASLAHADEALYRAKAAGRNLVSS